MAYIINPDWGHGHVMFAEEPDPVYEPYDTSDLPLQDVGPNARLDAINRLTDLRVAARAALNKHDAALYCAAIAATVPTLLKAKQDAKTFEHEARDAIRSVLKLRRDLSLFQGV